MKFPLVTILEDIRSALNVGAIFRTSDGAGIEKLYLTGITPYPPHKRIPKTALGAIDMIDWRYIKSTIDIIKELKNKGYTVVSAELDNNSQDYTTYEFPAKTALIFGNEINGVSDQILKLSDAIVHVPMYGGKESLNVATTYGIMVYEIVRQWKEKL